MVKNLPCNAGDVGLIPGQGTKIPYAAGQLSPCALEPMQPQGMILCAPTKTRDSQNKI